MSLHRTSLGLMLTLTLAAIGIGQQPAATQTPLATKADGSIDIDRLRDQTLARALPGMPLTPLPEANQGLEMLSLASWGLELAPLPTTLKQCHESLSDGRGMLITKIDPMGSAQQARLVQGLVLLSVDGHPVMDLASLPTLDRPRSIEILTSEGVQQVEVQPSPAFAALPQAGGTLSSLLGFTQSRAYSGTPQTTSARSYSASGMASSYSVASPSAPSASVAVANGQYAIDVTVSTASGPQRVHLEGDRQEVERELNKLPQDIQTQVRQSTGL
ncbi:hypothetical protein Mal64_10960 [Pseudobythopirellula maris]|uniref:PDZ domain-containing protein n=1 Tax=Pseudobythopirellula maris TaxID=2527991 RepID=A0A5C5ZUW9_9BACT|nr:hypothetical protein [Pseudobythopirellula maris]TWT90701.1 hypothetical protein Mal64_10960 [Pseudobythopirellula maris]